MIFVQGYHDYNVVTHTVSRGNFHTFGKTDLRDRFSKIRAILGTEKFTGHKNGHKPVFGVILSRFFRAQKKPQPLDT